MVYLLYIIMIISLCAVCKLTDSAYYRIVNNAYSFALIIEGIAMMVWGAFLLWSGSIKWTQAETVVGFIVPALLMITMDFWWPYVPYAFRELAGKVANDLVRLGWSIIGVFVFKSIYHKKHLKRR